MSDHNDDTIAREEYTVERIVDKREHEGATEYFVKWLGYNSMQNTWVRAENCNCPALIVEYEDLQKSKEPVTTAPVKPTAPVKKQARRLRILLRMHSVKK